MIQNILNSNMLWKKLYSKTCVVQLIILKLTILINDYIK